jgi:hypothetical protein
MAIVHQVGMPIGKSLGIKRVTTSHALVRDHHPEPKEKELLLAGLIFSVSGASPR